MIITPLYAGLLAIWYLVLSARVVGGRRSGKINLGDGGDERMQHLIRGHANFGEYVPLILVLMVMLEVSASTPVWLLHVLGITLLVARLLHGVAFSFAESFFFGRFWGTVLTFVLLLVLGALCLWRGIFGLVLATS